MSALSGQTAVVTGASSGIGAATARHLAALGARVVLAARSFKSIAFIARELTQAKHETLAVECDVTSDASVAALAARTREAFGRVDILVNNAGVGLGGTVRDMPVEDFDATMATNLRGPFIVTKAMLPLMTPRPADKWGTIINVVSVSALNASAGLGAYSASKFGLRGLSQAMALELAREHVRVVALNPGYVATPMVIEDDAGAKRMIQPEHAAKIIADLCQQPASVLIDELTIWPKEMYTE